MKIENIYQFKEWFEVLQTTDQCQTEVMNLPPGRATGQKAEFLKESEQILLLLEGQLLAEIAGKEASLNSGDVFPIAHI